MRRLPEPTTKAEINQEDGQLPCSSTLFYPFRSEIHRKAIYRKVIQFFVQAILLDSFAPFIFGLLNTIHNVWRCVCVALFSGEANMVNELWNWLMNITGNTTLYSPAVQPRLIKKLWVWPKLFSIPPKSQPNLEHSFYSPRVWKFKSFVRVASRNRNDLFWEHIHQGPRRTNFQINLKVHRSIPIIIELIILREGGEKGL